MSFNGFGRAEITGRIICEIGAKGHILIVNFCPFGRYITCQDLI